MLWGLNTYSTGVWMSREIIIFPDFTGFPFFKLTFLGICWLFFFPTQVCCILHLQIKTKKNGAVVFLHFILANPTKADAFLQQKNMQCLVLETLGPQFGIKKRTDAPSLVVLSSSHKSLDKPVKRTVSIT